MQGVLIGHTARDMDYDVIDLEELLGSSNSCDLENALSPQAEEESISKNDEGEMHKQHQQKRTSLRKTVKPSRFTCHAADETFLNSPVRCKKRRKQQKQQGGLVVMNQRKRKFYSKEQLQLLCEGYKDFVSDPLPWRRRGPKMKSLSCAAGLSYTQVPFLLVSLCSFPSDSKN